MEKCSREVKPRCKKQQHRDERQWVVVPQPADLRQKGYYSWGSEWGESFKFNIARVGSDPLFVFVVHIVDLVLTIAI